MQMMGKHKGGREMQGRQTNGSKERAQGIDERPAGLSTDNDDHTRTEHAQENGATRH